MGKITNLSGDFIMDTQNKNYLEGGFQIQPEYDFIQSAGRVKK
ncbi:hypothetical protein [Niallia sp. 01092]